MKRMLLVAMCSAFLASCGGGGGTSTPGNAPANATPFTTANVSVSVAIPRTTSSTRRAPEYVPSGTASMSVTVGGATTTAACAAPMTTCTVDLAAPLGSDTFTVTLLDPTQAVLASGSTTFTVTANVLNTINLTFDGVIHAITATLSTPTIILGAAASSTLTIVAKDAAGATIVPPGNYTQPIVVTTIPSTLPASLSLTGTTTISTIPASSPTIDVAYDGTVVGTSSIVFNATAGTVTGTATLTFPTTSGVTLSPTSLQFTTIPASPQTVTISEANYAGTFSVSPACNSIATISAVTGGQFTVTPLAVGACIAIVSDTLGGNRALSVRIATTVIRGS